jgi:RNA polymerase sigma factor (sigma-70 family)
MELQDADQRLSLIPTLWSLVQLAHHGPVAAARTARQQLLERYQGAIYRYLRKLLHDPDAADEVFQEFALELVHGKLQGADRQRGRFRNFVKGTLFHLVADYRRRQRRWPAPLPAEVAGRVEADEAACGRLFLESWRDELLARAWGALATIEATTGQPLYAVLRFRADHPEMHSPQLAEELAVRLRRPFTAASVRQTLHRARVKFAALLVEEVSQSLADPGSEHVDAELLELGLFEYCQPRKRVRR